MCVGSESESERASERVSESPAASLGERVCNGRGKEVAIRKTSKKSCVKHSFT